MEKIITESELANCRALTVGMMRTIENEECEFRDEWILSHGWAVVPVESGARLPREDIPRLVSVLNAWGFQDCVAIMTETPINPPEVDQDCYRLSVTEGELREVNRELGPYRFLLTDRDRSWAISCNEWYNLFGAEPALAEALLGRSIESTRKEFEVFGTLLGRDNYYPLVLMARRYESLSARLD